MSEERVSGRRRSLRGRVDDATAKLAARVEGQGELLPIPAEERAALEDERQRGPGRPEGATNTIDRDFIAHLLAGGNRDPREFLSDCYSVDVRELAAYLGYTPKADGTWDPKVLVEIWAGQRAAATAALPYFASKKPIELQVDERHHVTLTIAVSEDQARALQARGPDGTTLIEGVFEDAKEVETVPSTVSQENEENQ